MTPIFTRIVLGLYAMTMDDSPRRKPRAVEALPRGLKLLSYDADLLVAVACASVVRHQLRSMHHMRVAGPGRPMLAEAKLDADILMKILLMAVRGIS